jgi:hypothetical protein
LGDFGERGCRNIMEYIMDIFVNIIGEMIWFLFFPSLFSDFGERGYGNIMDIFDNIIGEHILDRDI